MANITPGTYSIGELLRVADVDHMDVAAVDYNESGWDSRRLSVGGLSFDSLDDKIVVPEAASEVSISVDGEEVASLSVE